MVPNVVWLQIWRPTFAEKQAKTIGGNHPPKTYESYFFTIILNNSENSIGDIWPFCRQFFRHNSAVKYTYLSWSIEPVMRLDYQISLKSPL